MARRVKPIEVQKFGGVDELGHTKMHGYDHDVKDLEVQSKTKLEDDIGYGKEAIIRCFEFGINPLAFKEHPPTKQELFNAHYKGIEVALWKDGLKVIPEVNPRIVIDEQNMRYKIFVGAHPMKGHLVLANPQTLKQIAHD